MDVTAELAAVGVRVPVVLLPTTDLHAWAVVACDQFTSQPEYWRQAEAIVGTQPSTLRLIFPETYLDEEDPESRITSINATMAGYLAGGLFRELRDTLVLVRRETQHGIVRWGLIVALDLEHYSWEADARTLIRATEGTILDRLPPRVAIRREADLELPHIMVLISDERRKVIEPLASAVDRLAPLYDTELMLDGGRVSGWAVTDPADVAAMAAGLTALHATLDPANPLLFAMGDGNHSFATAKSIWNDIRDSVPAELRDTHPARFCLVELENIYDPGLEFEPIHRVLFGIDRHTFETALIGQCVSAQRIDVDSTADALTAIKQAAEQTFGYVDQHGAAVYRMSAPKASIAAGTLQRVIDGLVNGGSVEVDYIHGADVTERLAQTASNIGLLLPPVAKESFFASIVADGELPRKTFSLGEAQDKRYYLEARAIR